MVCAECDFGDPCACERKRVIALASRRTDDAGGEDARRDLARLEGRLRDASNMIAALLLAGSGGVPAPLAEEAEALLAKLRTE